MITLWNVPPGQPQPQQMGLLTCSPSALCFSLLPPLIPFTHREEHPRRMKAYAEGGPRRLLYAPRLLPVCYKDGTEHDMTVSIGELHAHGWLIAVFRVPS